MILRIFSCLLFCTLYFSLKAQEREEELVYELIDYINDERENKNLPILEQDEILDAAAFDQAKYIAELKKIVHEQDNEKKKTVQKRVLIYEGLHANLGENASIIDLNSKESLEPNGPRVLIETEEMLLQAAVNSWLEDDISTENLLDPQFYNIGASIIILDEKKYIIVVVFGSLPYKNLTNKKPEIKFHGIEPYKKEECREILADHSTLPELLSDAVVVENNEAFFKYHNLSLIQHILSNSNDAIVADVVQREQFKCNEGNRLFPTDINDGYLMYPMKKAKLGTQNSLDSIKEVKVSLGVLPEFYKPETSEINLVIVKKGHHCMTVPYNQLKTENKKWFAMPFVVAGDTDSAFFKWQDSIQFEYSTLTQWKENFGKDFETLKRFNYQLKSIEITHQNSPINKSSTTVDSASLAFLKGNFELKQLHTIAWDSLQKRIKNTYYQLDLAELDTVEKIEFLKEAIVEDKDMKAYLDGLNRVFIQLDGMGTIENNLTTEEVMNAYKLFLKTNKIKPALYLQAHLLDKVRAKELKASQLPLADPSQKENTLPVINNQIVLETIMGAESYDGNPIYLSFFELYLINKTEPEVSFNYHISLLKHWSENPKEIKEFDSWLKEFRKIPVDKISPIQYAKAMLNYYLLAVDYYYEKNNFSARKKAITELLKWQKKAVLTDKEVLDLASFLCFQDQYDEAIKLLAPYVKKEEVDNQIMFYFLQIAQYNKLLVPTAELEKYFKKAKENFPKAFCALFSKEKMGIQMLKNYSVKQLYCEACE